MSPVTQIIIIVVLVFVAVVLLLKPMSRADEDAIRRMDEIKRGVRRPPKQRKWTRLFKKDAGIESKPLSTRAAESINDFLSPYNRKKPLTKNDREIKKLFAVANVNISMFTFTVLRAVFGALLGGPCLVLGFLLKPSDFPVYLVPAFAVGMFLAGTLLPKAILRMSANHRRTAIVSSLTDTIDLIAISVEAGLGYDSAILNIWKENKSPAMQELVRTIEDINYGMSRRDAYLSLAARCDVDEMSLFSNNMVQADTMGISIVNVLKAQAEALRVARRRRAETLVQKAPVKMLFPLVFFVFPTMLLVLLGPAIINIEKYL